ncbi:hypothetical protein IB276_22400 [Ensifer sp. ENS04]|uniref:hypothetical protein n=1 Tax=Ensifer sp. ENS04 TaxID=2769281 RepID=UPI00177AF502|nr:hypothetical protein [Ensifer sp. ENS04]MBD9542199.1 hypothetical protein [Ensifer sp. ENS04]
MSKLPEITDLAGVPFQQDTRVAWFISGRYGSGMVIGFVSRMEIVPGETSHYDYASRTYIKTPVEYLEVDLKPLVDGRKLRTMKLLVKEGVVADEYGGRDVIVIANQEFGR